MNLSADEVQKLRAALGIKVLGAMASKPVVSFAHMNLDEKLMKAVRKAMYETPTPIQAQAIPLALNGRDLIGVFHCLNFICSHSILLRFELK